MSRYNERIRNYELERAEKCEICQQKFPPNAIIHLHSATGMHLVLIETDKGLRYKITRPPEGRKDLKGKTLPIHIYPEGVERGSDAICLCQNCHVQLHDIVVVESQRRNIGKNEYTTGIVLEITRFLVARAKPIYYT